MINDCAVVFGARTVAPAQREVGAKTNETAAFRPLLEPLDLTGTVVTFDALHSVKDQVRWLVQEKKAHHIGVLKGNQPTASARIKALPWEQVPVAHTVSGTGHGRRESRSVKSMAIPAGLGGIAFKNASAAGLAHPPAPSGERQAADPGAVYAVTNSTPTKPALLTWAETCAGTGESKIPATMPEMWWSPKTPPPSTGSAPRVMAALRNLAIGRLRLLGADNIARTARAIRDTSEQAAWIWGITDSPLLPGT